MLKLHSLEISGFKSFLDPVEVRFAEGITAIVGPNGCGKSNLTDAINWVLGEQSAKSLRGATMQDVIFNGSAKRKPVGMAEVTLVFSCDPGFPRSENGQLKIGRQVFRTGESRYRLNTKVVRLKEIKDLLMDTGLGTRAYSVIEQGKIGMILSNKPAERRKLLEEAAGITRYKARKRVAEVKLEETLGNLMRLDDIISEVERSLRSLKRQASAARRYKAKEAEYHDLLRRTLLGRWVLQKGRLDGLGGRVEGLENREAELTATLGKDEAGLAADREELDKLSLVLAERHQAVAELAATLEGRQEFLKGARQRDREMGERLTRGRAQTEERRERIDELKSSLGGLDERARQALEERDEAARLVAEDEQRITAAQHEVEAAEARLEGLRGELMASVAKVNQASSALQQMTVEIERSAYRLRYLDDERERLDRQLAESRGTLDAVSGELSEAETEVATLADRRSTLDAALEGVLRREAELAEERREAETHLAGLRQRQKILIQLSQQHEERRRAVREALAEIGVDTPRFLADVLEPADGWAETIDHFLGELADAVLVDAGSALETARALAETGTSGLFVRPLPEGSDPVEIEDESLAYSLAEALDLSPELARSLPPAFLVERAEDAERLAAEHPGIAFLSRDAIWARGGALRIQTPEAAPGVLARESELQGIAEEIPATETAIEHARTTLRSLVEERTRLASEIQTVDDRTGELKRRIAVAQARRQDVEGRQQKVAAEHGSVAEEQGELRAKLDQQKLERTEREAALETAQQGHGGLTESFDRAQAEVEAARQRREALRTEGAGRRGRLDLLVERLESQGQEAQRVQRQIEETNQQVIRWADEEQALERRLHELRVEMDRAEAELQAALDRRAIAEEAVLDQQRQLDAAREGVRGLEEQVQETRKARDAVRSDLEGLRVDRAGARQDAEHLMLSYREAFGKLIPGTKPPEPPPEAIALDDAVDEPEGAEIVPFPGTELAVASATDARSAAESVRDEDDEGHPDDEATDAEAVAEPHVWVEDEVELPEAITSAELTTLEAELARTKAAVERLGPVNVLAAEEYEEQEERRGFLKKQRTDVARSVESLKQTIAEINELSSERFKTTFEAVNKVFGETFQRLFRGGEAHMSLFDEDDLLETGIEITARPPGKRPQNISLLSGGEKALTAIALLFALFQSKPSPFCILDEVDAPLDDANVLRFVETLEELARDTQFLVVTHNKLTMEVASTLYGVTMQEKGVSKLVQAKMDSLHPEPE
ncbi:MAG: AAA family ATPase, partial [Acidobacteriota bacterium]